MEIRWVVSFCDGCDGDHRGLDYQVLSSARLSSEEDAWSCKFLYFRNGFLGCSPFISGEKKEDRTKGRKNEVTLLNQT